jgi:hypothetical protein
MKNISETIPMQDMVFLLKDTMKNPNLTIQRWISEGILLPKVSGHIRDARYPVENRIRIQCLKDMGVVAKGKKYPYSTLRLTLWVSGIYSEGLRRDLITSLYRGESQLKKLYVKDFDLVQGNKPSYIFPLLSSSLSPAVRSLSSEQTTSSDLIPILASAMLGKDIEEEGRMLLESFLPSFFRWMGGKENLTQDIAGFIDSCPTEVLSELGTIQLLNTFILPVISPLSFLLNYPELFPGHLFSLFSIFLFIKEYKERYENSRPEILPALFFGDTLFPTKIREWITNITSPLPQESSSQEGEALKMPQEEKRNHA